MSGPAKIAAIVVCIIIAVGMIAIMIWMYRAEHRSETSDTTDNDKRKDEITAGKS